MGVAPLLCFVLFCFVLFTHSLVVFNVTSRIVHSPSPLATQSTNHTVWRVREAPCRLPLPCPLALASHHTLLYILLLFVRLQQPGRRDDHTVCDSVDGAACRRHLILLHHHHHHHHHTRSTWWPPPTAKRQWETFRRTAVLLCCSTS